MRINKYLASLGVASRRKIDQLVEEGQIKINDQVATLGQRVDPLKDKINVSGREILPPKAQDLRYVILNKPKGVVSTVSDELNRKTVLNFVSSSLRLFPVGRLDQNTTGLILLTNDGELANLLTHPKFHLPKSYRLVVQGQVPKKSLERFARGVRLQDGITAPAEVKFLGFDKTQTELEVILYEGKNRQIRRMCGALNIELLSLQRIAFGPVLLGDLKEGESRKLTEAEIMELKKLHS